MKKITKRRAYGLAVSQLRLWLLMAMLGLYSGTGFSQAAGYYFAQSNQAFSVPTTGFVGTNGLPTTTPALFGTVWDDPVLSVTLPFLLDFNGESTSSMSLSANGYASFGNTNIYPFYWDLYSLQGNNFSASRSNGSNVLTGISSTSGLKIGQQLSGSGISAGTIITAIGTNTVTMSSNATNSGNGSVQASSGIFCTVTGTAPNRVFTISYVGVAFFHATLDNMDFKVEFSETTNVIRFVYGSMSVVSTSNIIVGITSSNLVNPLHYRTTATNWSASTESGVGGSYMALSPTVFPPSGLTFTWFPCIAPTPAAAASQTFCGSATVANLAATGSGTIQWFSSATGGSALPSNTALVNGSIYYVGQTVSGCADSNRAAVTVTIQTPLTYYADADGDSYGNPAITVQACTQPLNYVLNNTDCSDSNGAVNPGQVEICNGIDDDCDGLVDGYDPSLDWNSAIAFYIDADQDGYGNSSSPAAISCTPPFGYVSNNADCNDSNAAIHPGATEICDGVDNDCDGLIDGADPGIDLSTGTTFYLDSDGDGFGGLTSTIACVAPLGYVANSDDCNDGNGAVHPAATEICDGIDNDCDGLVDGNDPNVDNSTGTLFYLDADADGYGGTITTMACIAPANHVTNSGDCDDTRASVHPGAAEIGYNLIDDDCDGLTDEGFAPKSTTIQSAQCNMTLAAIDSQLIANLVAGAQGYRWRITTMSGPSLGQVQEIDTPLRVMKITQLANYAFATQYKVEVAVYYAGYLQPFTPSNCTVSTPATTTALSVCGQNITSMSNIVYANLVPFASGYRFRITDPVNIANSQTIERANREFRMNLITNFAVQYNKVYNVDVSVKNTDGSWLPFGPACNVTTPLFPTTSLQDSQCEDFIVPAWNTQIYASSYPGAIAYVFRLSGPGLVAPIEVTKSIRTFTLQDFAGQLIPGATYNVNVRLIFNFADPAGPYGKTCSIIVPGLSRVAEPVDRFNAVAYPNPFSETFNIKVESSLAEQITFKVYDMTGRLLEHRNVKAGNEIQIGESYPGGVYNVIVSQADQTKTIRVVKR